MDELNEKPDENSPFLPNATSIILANAEKADKYGPRRSSMSSGHRSRFQVVKVDFVQIDEANNIMDEDEDEGGTQSPEHSTYDTHNVKSLRHYTREALPRASHYRDILSIHTHQDRPTLDDLHNPSITIVTSNDSIKSPDQRKKSESLDTKAALKLGWIQGVLVRCLLNIWGVMLFLRLSWVVGQSGILLGCLVVLLATVVTFLTTISMSAICTNGEVKGGGAYYMISRSLGPEFGGAIGAIFSLANAVAVAMYVVGFSETVQDLITKTYGISIVDGDINDIRIIGTTTTTILLGISIIGMEWENKTQLLLLVILAVAMVDFLLGSFFPPGLEKQAQGFLGYSFEVFKENLGPNFRSENFFSVFAVFFPAATGILAGANISGDLTNPSHSIPKGTFLAIIVTSASYLVFAVISGSTVIRDANGIIEYVENGLNLTLIRDCNMTENGKCEYGLMNSAQVMELVSLWGPIIYAGIFAATLSSALASLVSAPKIFQALSRDKLFPYIQTFAKGYGVSNEPRRAYILAYIIAILCVLIGKLNSIAPIISNFFLAAYGLINFSCFHASSANTPGFRPAFKYYNKWLSLVGSILCLVVMFIINWWTALVTFALMLFLYVYIYYRKPDVNWGSSAQAETYNKALRAVKNLSHVAEHVKNFRPQILVLTGRPSSRTALLDFSHCITKKISLLVCGHVERNPLSEKRRRLMMNKSGIFFKNRKIHSFYDIKEDQSFSNGAKALMELSGIGKLRPNVLVMGYKTNWQESPAEDVFEYFKTIHYAFDLHMSVCILRLPEGLDFGEYADIIEEVADEKKFDESNIYADKDVELGIPRNTSQSQLSGVLKPATSWFSMSFNAPGGGGSSGDGSPPSTPAMSRYMSDKKVVSRSVSSIIDNSAAEVRRNGSVMGLNDTRVVKQLPEEVVLSINRFQRKQKKGTIDVWWLYDDGGLTMLIPYILSTRSQWKQCTIRVFTLANRKDELDHEKRYMAALLSKFRIDFSDVTVIPDIVKPPSDYSIRDFEEMISKWKENGDNNTNNETVITESELIALKDKSNRHIRLRELLFQYSSTASFIVMTLPIPRTGTCSAHLFMAWLETLTKDMPPFLLVRGNQTSVLTFYS